MNRQAWLLYAIMFISLAYSIYYLIRGKEVKIVCRGSNKIIIYIIYLILSALVIYKNTNRLGIITAAIIIISGILYNLVPSGYNDKGIYLRGKFFSFKKMAEMSFDYVNDYYQLSFSYHGKSHVLLADKEDKEKLKGAYSIYKNIKDSTI